MVLPDTLLLTALAPLHMIITEWTTVVRWTIDDWILTVPAMQWSIEKWTLRQFHFYTAEAAADRVVTAPGNVSNAFIACGAASSVNIPSYWAVRYCNRIKFINWQPSKPTRCHRYMFPLFKCSVTPTVKFSSLCNRDFWFAHALPNALGNWGTNGNTSVSTRRVLVPHGCLISQLTQAGRIVVLT